MKHPFKIRVWDKINLKTVRFADAHVYTMDDSGAIHRLSPQRPWRGKSERRRVIAKLPSATLAQELLRRAIARTEAGNLRLWEAFDAGRKKRGRQREELRRQARRGVK